MSDKKVTVLPAVIDDNLSLSIRNLKNVSLVKATPRSNPITGQHVELSVQANSNKDIDISSIKKFMREQLPAHMMPMRIIIEEVEVGHRYKRT